MTQRLLILALVVSSCVLTSHCQTSPGASGSAQQHLNSAQQYLHQNRPDLAIPELEAAASIEPANPDTQANLGVLYYFKNDFGKALPHLRVAVQLKPGIWKTQVLLGVAELRTEDFPQGRKDLEAAFPLISDRKYKVQIGLELVSLYAQTGELDDAASVLVQLRKTDPENAEVIYAAYRTYSDLAVESMLSLSLAATDSAQMHQLLAHEETRRGNLNEAIAHYRKAIAINPHLASVHFELAELMYTSVDEAVNKEAEREFRTALLENPRDEKAVLRLAAIDAKNGNVERSFAEFTKAVQLQPTDTDAKLGLAKALIERSQENMALPLLEDSVRMEPTNITAHYLLGTLYRKSGRMEDAKREVELYKKYKEMKDKLRAIYKELQIQPKEIVVDQMDGK